MPLPAPVTIATLPSSRPAGAGVSVKLGQQGLEVEGVGGHPQLAVGPARPLLPGAVAVELDAVAVGVVEVDRLAHPVVGGARDARARLEDPAQGVGQAPAVGIEDGVVVKPGAAGGRRGSVPALPGVEAKVMVIAAGGEEGGLVTEARLELEPE